MKDARDARWEIRQTLKVKGFEPDIHDAERYIGDLDIGHQKVSVAIEVRDLSFCIMPRVHILNRQSITWNVLAHTQSETGVCYGQRGFYSLDPARPGSAVLRVLEDVERTLLQSSKGRGSNEVALEYAAYWGGPEYSIYARHPLSPKMQVFESVVPNSGPKFIIAESRKVVPSNYSSSGISIRVINLPNAAQPDGDTVVPETLAQLLDWLGSLGITELAKTEIIKAAASNEGIIIEAQNGNYGAFLSLPDTIKGIKNPRLTFLMNQVSKTADSIDLTRIRGTTCDLEAIVKRSLPDKTKTLSDYSVCLVGCGAIGSHLARLLSQLGAGNRKAFTIIDPDILKPGNIGRHALGFAYLEQSKAEAMVEELRRFHPQIKGEGLRSDVVDLRAKTMRHDLIVDATGVENVSCLLNEWNRQRPSSARGQGMFHSFLFGHGIAAQSFANLGGEAACFRCLRPSRGEGWRYDPRKADARHDQPLDTGCGEGVFLPYGPYAGTAAASLTAQHIHEWVIGIRRGQLRTLVIDTERGKHIKPTTPLKAQDCPSCA